MSPSFRQSEAVREKPLAAPSAFKPAEAAGDGSNSSGLEREAQDGLERFAQFSLFKMFTFELEHLADSKELGQI